MLSSQIIRLFGDQIPKGAVLLRWRPVVRHEQWAGWILLVAVVAAVVIGFSYRRADEELSARRKGILAALRISLVTLLLLLLLQPALRLTVQAGVRRTVLFLADASASMAIHDPRTNDDDRIRAAIARGVVDPSGGLHHPLPPLGVSAPADPSRVDLLRAVLLNPKLDLLNRLEKSYDLRPSIFGATVADLASTSGSGDQANQNGWVGQLSAAAPQTPLGDAVRELLGRSRGQPLAGIVLATDGQGNTGSSPLAAAELARSQGVPLYIYGIGISNPKDVVVSRLYAPDICFVKDDVPVTVRVRGSGLAGEHGQVVLKLGDTIVDQTDVTYDGSEQTVPMKLTPKVAGAFDLTASIAPRADESVKDNNTSAPARLRVIDGKIKVLLVDSSPRWEFKYLQAMLLRDRRIDLHCFLQEADPSVAEDAHSPYVKIFPATPPDLFDHYDLVIFGDADVSGLSARQLNDLSEFVSKFGGGLLFLPGQRFGVAPFAGTPLEKMLPVEMPMQNDSPPEQSGIRLELSAAGRRSPMLRLSDDETESAALWAKLPPIYWDLSAKAKAGAETLLLDPVAKLPVLAVQQYGTGQVMYLGTDNTWRWRKNIGDKYYATIWGQLVQRLALPHLLGESRRTQLSVDKKEYGVGDRVTVYARLYDEGYTPLTEPSVGGSYKTGDRKTAMTLSAVPDEPGVYRGDFVAPLQGEYEIAVDRDPKTTQQFTVTEPRLELAETAMNEPTLRAMASSSGGAFFREEDLFRLPDSIKSPAENVQSNVEIELWSTPILFAIALALATAEWIVRKISLLK